ncbi:MAG: transcription termination/antitermination protein NusG [bacterium]|nr:transcription termination/antitermination protein NusG [bacterium]
MESKKDWYVIHTYSGYENRVKSNIEQRIKNMEVENLIKQVLIPTEEVAEVKGGKKKLSTKKFFPGYILIEMEMSDKAWQVIKNTPGVFGFIGGKDKPIPIEDSEIETMLENISGKGKKLRIKAQFEEGENLRVIDGPFANFVGSVAEINIKKERLKLMISVLGRSTPVELQFHQVEKL